MQFDVFFLFHTHIDDYYRKVVDRFNLGEIRL